MSHNEPLTPIESATVRHRVDQWKTYARMREAEMIELTARLENLKGECDQLRSEIRNHESLLSSFRSFPLEILGQIIYLAVDRTEAQGRDHPFVAASPWDVTHKVNQRYIRQTFHYTHVCRRWRQAALATPSIWTNLAGVFHSNALFRTWFSRAGVLPKSLTISLNAMRSPRGFCGTFCAACSSGVDSIISQFQPWGLVSLEVAQTSCIEGLGRRLLASRPEAWHSIRRLRFTVAEFERDETDEPMLYDTVPLLPDLQSLTSLELNLIEILSNDHGGPDDLIIPEPMLQRLTSMTLAVRWSFTRIMVLLRSCEVLQDLWLLLADTPDEDREDHESHEHYNNEGVCLPGLQRLKIDLQDSERHLAPVLSRLRCPQLLDLSIDSRYSWRVVGLENTILSFVKRSSCNLQSLSWSTSAVARRELVILLKALPHLTKLSLGPIYQIDSSFLIKFYCPSDNHLPRLRELNLIEMPHDFEARNFLDFIAARGPRAFSADSDGTGDGRVDGGGDEEVPLQAARFTYNSGSNLCHRGIVEALHRGFQLDMDRNLIPKQFYSHPEPRDRCIRQRRLTTESVSPV
ncbi:hypothetical protein BKA70DRAFT_1116248 [Coprinopsis sp. MPI-PUGE-AT-0042]|nr:hypothetical protein BKA70DRAFT_1116248 [Coprinopsis sp. MPI-PUGE-AT-0042]